MSRKEREQHNEVVKDKVTRWIDTRFTLTNHKLHFVTSQDLAEMASKTFDLNPDQSLKRILGRYLYSKGVKGGYSFGNNGKRARGYHIKPL